VLVEIRPLSQEPPNLTYLGSMTVGSNEDIFGPEGRQGMSKYSCMVVFAPHFEVVCIPHRQINLQFMPLYSNGGDLFLWLLNINFYWDKLFRHPWLQHTRLTVP